MIGQYKNFNKDFNVDYSAHYKYELLTMEIGYKGQPICQLNKDKGVDHIEIELYTGLFPQDIENPIIFPLDEFMKLLNAVKDDLIEA